MSSPVKDHQLCMCFRAQHWSFSHSFAWPVCPVPGGTPHMVSSISFCLLLAKIMMRISSPTYDSPRASLGWIRPQAHRWKCFSQTSDFLGHSEPAASAKERQHCGKAFSARQIVRHESARTCTSRTQKETTLAGVCWNPSCQKQTIRSRNFGKVRLHRQQMPSASTRLR